MHVDKFGRDGEITTPVYTGINIANSVLRRDGGTTAIEAVRFVVKSRCATKNYVDTNARTTTGGVVSGDTKLSVASDLVRSL